MAYYGLLLFFILEYVRPTSYIPALIPLRLNLIVPLITCLAVVLFKRRQQDVSGEGDLNNKIIGTILVLLTISIPTAFMTDAASIVFQTVLGYAAMYWVITKEVTDLRRIKGVFKTLIVVHATILILSPKILLDPSSRTHGLMSGSFLGDGNDFALSLDIAIPFGLFLFFEAKNSFHKFLGVANLLFAVLGVIASQSRGGTIGLACVGLYYWVKSGKKLAMAFVTAVVLTMVFVVAPPTYFSRMNTIVDHSDGSAQGRITSWKYAWNEALRNPILGIGAGNTPFLHRQNSHSIYFMILGELGFPGLAALITLIAWNLVANRRLSKQIRPGPEGQTERQLLACLSASLIGFATAGAFLSAAYYPHAYILAGLLSAGRRIVRAQSRVAVADAPQLKAITYHWALMPPTGAKRLL